MKIISNIFIMMLVLIGLTFFFIPIEAAEGGAPGSSDPPPGGWVETGSMKTPRGCHIVKTLESGEVLVAGGWPGLNYHMSPLSTHSAELYNPQTGRWRSVGDTINTPAGQIKVLLPDGKVLVAGGWDFLQPRIGPLNRAELFDPATETWSATGRMRYHRDNAASVLLPDGKVLVMGGAGRGEVCSSAELYDPATGRWEPTGEMNCARNEPRVVLLGDDRVLVTGGYKKEVLFGLVLGNRSEYWNSTELYDPETGTFSLTGSMTLPRAGHRATLLADGRVLVTGGWSGEDSGTATAEIYDPATGSFSPAASMKQGRSGHQAFLRPDGRVVVVGGWTDYHTLDSSEIYDPETDRWYQGSSLNKPRAWGYIAPLKNGDMIITGGYSYPAGIKFPVIRVPTMKGLKSTEVYQLTPNQK